MGPRSRDLGLIGGSSIFSYIHENIFDEHMAINITMNVGLISALLGIFFFTYAATVEKSIVQTNAIIGVSNIMDMMAPLLNNKIKTDILKSLTIPDQSKEDEDVKKANDIITYNALSNLTIILDIGLTISFIIATIYNHSYIKMLMLNLIIVILVGCTEYTFLNFIPNNYISIDTNYIRYTILTTLKSKITINNEPLG
jgi:hypothetical protein